MTETACDASAPLRPWGRRLYEFGCRLSDRVANIAGHPTSIALVIIFALYGSSGWERLSKTP